MSSPSSPYSSQRPRRAPSPRSRATDPPPAAWLLRVNRPYPRAIQWLGRAWAGFLFGLAIALGCGVLGLTLGQLTWLELIMLYTIAILWRALLLLMMATGAIALFYSLYS